MGGSGTRSCHPIPEHGGRLSECVRAGPVLAGQRKINLSTQTIQAATSSLPAAVALNGVCLYFGGSACLHLGGSRGVGGRREKIGGSRGEGAAHLHPGVAHRQPEDGDEGPGEVAEAGPVPLAELRHTHDGVCDSGRRTRGPPARTPRPPALSASAAIPRWLRSGALLCCDSELTIYTH